MKICTTKFETFSENNHQFWYVTVALKSSRLRQNMGMTLFKENRIPYFFSQHGLVLNVFLFSKQILCFITIY